MRYFVGGVSGVGKSAIVDEFQQRFDKCDVIRGSDEMFAALGLRKGDYSTLRLLPTSLKDELFSGRILSLLGRAGAAGRDVLLDAHYLNFVNGQPRRVVGEWVCEMDALVLVEADANTIWSRIKSDKDRGDRIAEHVSGTESEYLISIERCVEQTRAEAERLSERYGKPLWTIDNSSGLWWAVEILGRVAKSGSQMQTG